MAIVLECAKHFIARWIFFLIFNVMYDSCSWFCLHGTSNIMFDTLNMNFTTSLNIVLELLYMCRVVTLKLCLIVSGICILGVNEILYHECSGTNFAFLEKPFCILKNYQMAVHLLWHLCNYYCVFLDCLVEDF